MTLTCVRKPGDLAGLLTNLDTGDVLFIDEFIASILLLRNTCILLWKTTELTS